MNTISLSNNTFACNFSLNQTVNPDQIALGDAFSCLYVVPQNSVNKVRNVGFSYEERRGALNAAMRFFFGLDDVSTTLHTYKAENPHKVGGLVGWMSPALVGLPVAGKWTDRIVTLDGTRYWLHLPCDKDGILYPQNLWMQLFDKGGNRLDLRNPSDEKWARNANILHTFLDDLQMGITLMIPVSSAMKHGDKGEWLDDAAQRRAKWINAQIITKIADNAFDYEALKEKYVADGKAYSYTQDALAEAKKNGETFQTGMQTVTTRLEGGLVGKLIMVDGAKVDLASVLPGNYKAVIVDGSGKTLRTYKPVINISRHAGGMILNDLERRGNVALETIATF